MNGVAVCSASTEGTIFKQLLRVKNHSGSLHAEKVMMVACENLMDKEAEANLIEIDSEKWLIDWRRNFEEKENRKPTKFDLTNDENAVEHFRLYSLRRKYTP